MDIKKIYGYAALKKNLGFLYKNLDDTYDPWTGVRCYKGHEQIQYLCGFQPIVIFTL